MSASNHGKPVRVVPPTVTSPAQSGNNTSAISSLTARPVRCCHLRRKQQAEAKANETGKSRWRAEGSVGCVTSRTDPYALLELPLRWRKPKTIFVNSMSDLFQAEVAEEFIQRVFRVMARATWHRFQALTKRADRLAQISQRLPWAANIWMGVSVEHQDYAFRIDYLRQVPARVRFV